MFGNILEKAQEAQKEMKERLGQITVTGDAESGMVTVNMSGNRKIKDIHIATELLNPEDKEGLEDLIITAVQRAIDKADALHAEEMKKTAKGIMPNIPGLF
jgi:DNA-binding YbaB/EbfC family protein